ncbi:MAG: phenylalanine--tRNA ligase subunit alpha [Phycisphaerales bacterium]|nr:phenylalanine--tRNA ligase subunit alpha [Phycisphaerales bacterium]
MAEVLEQIEQLSKEAAAELKQVANVDQLEQFRVKFLGTKGKVKDLMSLLGQVPREQKPIIGQRVNAVKQELTEGYDRRKEELAGDSSGGRMTVDVTEPGVAVEMGHRHILMKVIDELTELFGRMGFAVASGPEVEDEFHNFIALNIPRSHPARDPLDNFYLQSPKAAGGGSDKPSGSNQMLMRTQTSTVQIRVMEKQRPPIRVVIPGRVYRPDTHDDTHLSMFHQLEALVVDKHVTMVDLKSTVIQFVHAYFGPNTKVRFRPSFFPFTEPSAEVDVYFEDKQRWIELGGCGMVHPNVLKAVNIDPEAYSGWAFGFGIERIAMRKYGINNIRLLVENDIRFLRQF